MEQGTIQTLITAVVGPVLLALISFWMQRSLRRDVASVKEQTHNNHATNFRDDVDRAIKAAESADAVARDLVDIVGPMTGQIRTIGTTLTTLQKDVGGLKQENRDDRRETHDRIDGLAERVRTVEKDTRHCTATQ